MSKLGPIYYKTFGNPNNPCIVLINGIGGQLIHWPIEFTQGLAEKGFYIIVFDNRDAGLSHSYDELITPNLNEAIAAKQQGKVFDPPYTLEAMAADVISLMNVLQVEKAHIVGISMGGMIAQVIALTYPKRVCSLTCIATTSGDPQLPPAKAEVLEFFFSSQRQEEDMAAYINNKLQLYRLYNHPEHVDEHKIRTRCIETYQRAHNPAGFKRQLLAIICAEPRVEKLKKLSIPSLIIHGDFDPVFPVEHGEQLAQILANSQLYVIEKMGHSLPDLLCAKIVHICGEFYREIKYIG